MLCLLISDKSLKRDFLVTQGLSFYQVFWNDTKDHKQSFWYLGDDGMTSLHLAAQNGHIEVVHAILNQNNMPRKYINLPDEGGWTPLVWACENRHEEIIK